MSPGDGLLACASLLAYALATTVVAPLVLAQGSWWARAPRAALFSWVCALLSSVLCVLVSLVGFVVITDRLANGVAGVGSAFWDLTSVLLTWLLVALVGGVSALLGYHLVPLLMRQRRVRRTAGQVVLATPERIDSLTGRTRVRGIPVVFVRTSEPVAMSLPGWRRQIMVSTRLRSELTPSELRCVVEHEWAHLTQHHGLFVQLAHLVASALPRLPSASRFERAALLLVELIADDSAARRCGADTVCAALVSVGRLAQDESLLLRAARVRDRPPRPLRRGRLVVPEVRTQGH